MGAGAEPLCLIHYFFVHLTIDTVLNSVHTKVCATFEPYKNEAKKLKNID